MDTVISSSSMKRLLFVIIILVFHRSRLAVIPINILGIIVLIDRLNIYTFDFPAVFAGEDLCVVNHAANSESMFAFGLLDV